MSTFSASLRDFHRGACSIEQLETQIERDVALGSVAPEQLLEQLAAIDSELPLAPDALITLRRCISSAQTRLRTQLAAKLPAGDDATVLNKRPTRVGDVINDRFILEEEIGRGGMSQVFRAIDKRKLEAQSRNPNVALKIMTVDGIDPGVAFVAMQREAQKSQQLNHPNILRVNDFDRDGGIVFTTMELLQGDSLQQLIARTAPSVVPLEQAISIIKAMGEALAYAHESKIVHADFKPSNVFITSQGVVKVIDFGIARAIQTPDQPDDDKTVFDPRAALGALTPAYASPEMLEDKDADPRDDVYALGCVAYELITGRHPFSRLCATEARDSEYPLKRPKQVNDQQWQAIRHALAFEREQRSPSAREFLEELTSRPRFNPATLVKPALAATAVAVTTGAALWLWNLAPSADGPMAFRDCASCPSLLVVTAGSATVGLPASADAGPGTFEFPARTVTIAADFALGSREVTVGEFRQFVTETGGDFSGCRSGSSDWQPDRSLSWENPGFPQSDAHPVTCVTWDDAAEYAAWLSRRTGESYRLPSEAEWEYVARTHTDLPLTMEDGNAAACAGINVADRTAARTFPDMQASQCRDGFVFTAPVDRLPANAFADLRGNVFEWTQDCWNPSYAGAPADGAAWQSGDCQSRVLRGGSWYTAPNELRLSYRNRFETDYRSNTFGFRIARDIHEPSI